MNKPNLPQISAASADDADALAKLIDIAGEGIPSWLWGRSAPAGTPPLEIGRERARRKRGGFSFTNAMVARIGYAVSGMVLSYPIDVPPEDNPDELLPPIAPFVALEKQSVDTWYINAIGVFAEHQGKGLGRSLIRAAESQARQRGYEAMSIQVYAQNHGAVRLYARLGYELVSREPVREHPCHPYYTGDVLLLTKRLGQAHFHPADNARR